MSKNKRNGVRNAPDLKKIVSANQNSDLKNPAYLVKPRVKRIDDTNNLVFKKTDPKKIKKNGLASSPVLSTNTNIIKKNNFTNIKLLPNIKNKIKKPCEVKKALRRKILIINKKTNNQGTRSKKDEC